MTNAEKEVAYLLKKMGIKWRYEQPVFIWDENKRPRVWTPDFYLIPFGIYIEVCGSKEFDYKYRKNIFDNNGQLVIFLHLYKEQQKWIYHLLYYLKIFSDKRNYKLEGIININTSFKNYKYL